MTKVFVAQHPTEAHLVAGLLTSRGIPSEVQGEALFGARGEVPVTPATLPSVWVHDDSQVTEALEILKEADEHTGRTDEVAAEGEPAERAVPILPADDLRVAKAFYVERLGFRVLFEASDDGKEGLLGLERGTIRITIDAPMSGHGRDACVSLQVNSADDYYREWRDRVEIRHPPKDESWGARTFDVIDPFGNTIFVIGPIP